MNTLILYDSAFGNTEQLARAVADRVAHYGTVKLMRVPADGTAFERGDADILIVGGPTQRHGASEALRVFLDGMPRRALLGLAAAAFDTRYRMATWKSGSAARGIAGRLRRAGATLVVPPESFFVAGREGPLEQGELERAARWGEWVCSAFEASGNARRGGVAVR